MTSVPHDRVGHHLRAFLLGRRRTPRVLVVGNYGNGNLGDEAILSAVLEEVGDVCVPTVLTRCADTTRRLHDVAAVRTMSWRALGAALRADVLWIGGGGLFGNGMTRLPRLLPWIALVLAVLGKRVVFVAIGAYASAPRPVLAALRIVARLSPLVTVRDEESARVLGRRSVLVHDPAIDLPLAAHPAADAALAASGVEVSGPVLGVSVKPAMHADLNERQVRLALEAVDHWLTRTDGSVVLLALSSRGDFGFGHVLSDMTLAGRIRSACVDPARVALVGPDLHPREMKAVVARMDVVLAHRLHAQIFAWSTGVPLVGMSYEHKSDEFLRMAGRPCVDLRDPAPVPRWDDLLGAHVRGGRPRRTTA